MKLTRAKFASIVKLVFSLQDEIYTNAQGDNGEDVRIRRDKYRRKLEKMLTAKKRAK